MKISFRGTCLELGVDLECLTLSRLQRKGGVRSHGALCVRSCKVMAVAVGGEDETSLLHNASKSV